MKLTIKEAAKLLGTDERSIINWEKGRTVPKVYRLPAIIRFLGYNPLPKAETLSERLVAKRLERGWSRKAASRYMRIDESTLRGETAKAGEKIGMPRHGLGKRGSKKRPNSN